MVKVNTLDFQSSPTKTSVFVKFLIKISFLPITLNEDQRRIRFQFASLKTLIYLIIYTGGFILLNLSSAFIIDSETLEKISARNKLETFSVFSGGVCSLAIIFPLILSRGLDNLDTRLVWDQGSVLHSHWTNGPSHRVVAP